MQIDIQERAGKFYLAREFIVDLLRLVDNGREQHGLRAMKFTGKHQSTGAVLAIMMRSGAIADFELHEFKSELFTRIWLPRDCLDVHLRKQIAALLPGEVEERHVTIAEYESSSVVGIRADPDLGAEKK